ncbi:hypothetical protein JCM14635_35400 [Megalodesulfovibrio paquesii]
MRHSRVVPKGLRQWQKKDGNACFLSRNMARTILTEERTFCAGGPDVPNQLGIRMASGPERCA